jgi:hypothetical protein
VTVGADLVRLAIDPRLNIVRERRQATLALLSADLAELAAAGRLELRRHPGRQDRRQRRL